MPSSAWIGDNRSLQSFPTRRSSDLTGTIRSTRVSRIEDVTSVPPIQTRSPSEKRTGCSRASCASPSASPRSSPRCIASHVSARYIADRKSTRLNSSHVKISYAVFCLDRRQPISTVFPYTTLFRSHRNHPVHAGLADRGRDVGAADPDPVALGEEDGLLTRQLRQPLRVAEVEPALHREPRERSVHRRSEEHTSELQSRENLVCRLLLGSATTDLYSLSLHDALPISPEPSGPRGSRGSRT